MTTKKPRLNLYLSEDVAKKARNESERLGISMSAFISISIEHYFKHNNAVIYEMIDNGKKKHE